MPRPAERVKFPIDVQFHAACSSSELDEVKDLLSKGVDVNVANADGLTVLHQACIDNNYEVAQFLLSNGANVNAQDNEGWTPLHACASCSYTELAKLLLDKGADASIVSFELELPLDVAQGADMVALLKDWMQSHSIDEKAARCAEEQQMLRDSREWLASGDYPHVVDPRTGATALHIAAAKGYSEVLELLLKLPDVEVDATDVDGWTPFHAAAHWGKEKPLRLLAAAGASFDAITLTNQSIYDVADRDITMLLRQLREARRNEQKRAADAKLATSPPTVATRRKSDEEESLEMKLEAEGEGGDEGAAPVAPKLAKMDEKAAQEVEKEEEEEEEPTKRGLSRPAKEKAEGRPHTPFKPSSPPPSTRAEDKQEEEEEKVDEEEEAAVAPKPEEPTAATADRPEEEEKEEAMKAVEDLKTPEREASPPRQTPAETIELPTALSPPPPSPPPTSTSSSTSSVVTAPGKSEQVVSDPSPAPPPPATNPNQAPETADTSAATVSTPSRRARHHRRDQTKIKRISAVLAPARSEEAEAQRSSKARLVRSTRRSTQGIASDVLEEARRLSAASAPAPKAPSPTPTPVQPKATKETADDSEPESASPSASTHVSKATIIPTQPSSPSSTATTNSTESTASTPSIIAHSRARRAARDRVPTGKLNTDDVLAAAKQLEQNASENSSESGSTILRPTTRLLRSTILNTTPSNTVAAVNNGGGEHHRPSPASRQLSPSPAANSAARSVQPAASASKSDHRYNWRENLDYRRLYEEERIEKERLKRTLDHLTRDVNALRSELSRFHMSPNHSASSSTRISAGGDQRRSVDFFEAQAKEIDRLRQENARMADENKSLIRVISKLSARTTS